MSKEEIERMLARIKKESKENRENFEKAVNDIFRMI